MFVNCYFLVEYQLMKRKTNKQNTLALFTRAEIFSVGIHSFADFSHCFVFVIGFSLSIENE